MRRYVCYVGVQGLDKSDADVHFQDVKVKVETQWNSSADNSILIFVKDTTSSRTEILGLPN